MFTPKKRVYKNNEVVNVKKSYYTFSRIYPGNILEKEYDTRKNKIKSRLFIALFSIFTIVLVFSGWFITKTVIDISNLEIKEKDPIIDKNEVNVLSDGELKAYYFPIDKLSDSRYINSFINRLKWRDAEAVVLEFKDSEGNMIYSSNQLFMRNSLYDNDTIQKAIDKFISKKIAVIASVYCFEDNVTSDMIPDMTVKYPNSDISWLDGENGRIGKCWLNPYSEKTQEFIVDTIKEISEFKVDGFILKSLSFPTHGDINQTYFPGEEESDKSRAQIIKEIIDKIDKSVPGFVSVELSDRFINSDYNPYYTTNLDLGVNTIVDLESLDVNDIVDKEAKIEGSLSYISNVCSKFQGKCIVSIYNKDSSDKLIRTLKLSGYNKIVVQ